MSAMDRLPEDDARELKRLCEAYEEATASGDINLARRARASISDYVASIVGGDSELETDLRRELCFPVEPSPTAMDQ